MEVDATAQNQLARRLANKGRRSLESDGARYQMRRRTTKREAGYKEPSGATA